jgi:capsular exopolysaccharide synthesis family protein
MGRLPAGTTADPGRRDVTFREWVHELAGRWRWIAGGLGLGLLTAGALATLSPPVYAAHATLYVSPAVPSPDAQSVYQGGLFSQQRMKSYVALITGTRVAQDVVDTLGLRAPAEEVAQQISAVAQTDTVILTVTAEDSSADGAAQLANATAGSFRELVTRLEQTPDATRESPVRVQVVQRASPHTTPIAPALSVYLVLGGILGLLVGLGAAALRKALDDTVRSTAVLQGVMDAPVLGTIPVAEEPRGGAAASEMPSQVEAYRRVRTCLHHGSPGLSRGVLVLASAVRGDGRSTVVCNLAEAMAAGGDRVLVVDADMRRPALGDRLGTDDGRGLTDVLVGGCSLSQAIESPTGSFDVLFAGRVPANPSELAGSQQLADVLGELRQRYDVVLLDSPPLLEVTDGAELAAHADGTIVVSRFGRTTYSQVGGAVEALRGASARLLGGLVTMVPPRAPWSGPPRLRRAHDVEPGPHGEPMLRDTLRPARRSGSSDAAPPPRTAAPGWAPLEIPFEAVSQPSGTAVSPNHHGTISPERPQR